MYIVQSITEIGENKWRIVCKSPNGTNITYKQYRKGGTESLIKQQANNFCVRQNTSMILGGESGREVYKKIMSVRLGRLDE